MARNSIIRAVITGDTTGLDRALGQSETALGRFGRNATRAFAGVTAGLGVAVVAAKPFVDAASDMNEAASKADVIFGDSADAIQAWSRTTAEAFGVSRVDALDAASSLAAFGNTAGLTGDDLSGFSSGLVEAAADFASFNNLATDEALTKFLSGLAGETEALRRYGIDLSAARVEAQALEMGLGGLNGELTEGDKILARQALLYEDLGSQGAMGDFARTSDSLANQQRILSARFADVQAELGQKLLPVAIKLAEWALDMFDAAEALADIFSEGGLQGVLEALTDRFEWLGPVIEYITMQVNYAKRAWEIFGDDVIRFVTRMFNAVKDVFEGIGLVVKGLTDFVSALIKGDWSAAMDAIGSMAEGALLILEGAFKGAFAAIALAFTTLFQSIDEMLGGWPSRLTGWAQDFFSAAINLGKALVDGIVSGIKSAPGAIVDAIQSLIPGGGILGDAADMLFPDIGGLNPFGGGGGGSTDAIADLISSYQPAVQVVMPDGRVLAETVAQYNDRTGVR